MNHEALGIVKRRLIEANYKKIQYYPTAKTHFPGRELKIFRSFIVKDNVSLFKASVVQPLYERNLRRTEPRLFNLYMFFFLGKELPPETLLEFFSQNELDFLRKTGILSYAGERFLCNFRFAPVDDLLIIFSPIGEMETVDYVHFGKDTIDFWTLLKRECAGPIGDLLEIGCGAGWLSLWLSRNSRSVVATDISSRALEFAQLNADINGVSNVSFIRSDVYSGVTGTYDVIISNPPFDYLPVENVKSLFSYGGFQGLEIVGKILLGLDTHLNDRGVSYLLANSYIYENGTSTLYELVKRIFHQKPFSITLQPLFYLPAGRLTAFYRRQGISKCIHYFIKIQKASNYRLNHIPIRGLNRVMEEIKCRLR